MDAGFFDVPRFLFIVGKDPATDEIYSRALLFALPIWLQGVMG